MKYRGKHCLVYFDGEKEISLPLLNEKNEIETMKSYLSNWDDFTCMFKNDRELFIYYKSKGYLTGEMLENTFFYIHTNECRKEGFQKLDVAYQDDLILQCAMRKWSNEINQNNPYVAELLDDFIRDLKMSRDYLSGLVYPVASGMNKTYLDPFLLGRMKFILYFKTDSPTEMAEITEEKRGLIKKIRVIISEHYRRFRGVYFFYKDLHPKRITRIHTEMVTDDTGIPPINYGAIEENNPYLWYDPFDRPEEETEYSLPSFPDEEKVYKKRNPYG